MQRTPLQPAPAITPAALAREVDAALRKGGTPARREVSAWYFPTEEEALGVGAKHLRGVVRDALRRIRGREPGVAISTARAILGQRPMEGRQGATGTRWSRRPSRGR